MMHFYYDPMVGLQYNRIDETRLLTNLEEIAAIDVSPAEVLDLFHKRGVFITNSSLEPDDFLQRIVLNGQICEYPIQICKNGKYNGARHREHLIHDEVGQWKKPEDLLLDEIIRMLNE